jgi:hypothetical protein
MIFPSFLGVTLFVVGWPVFFGVGWSIFSSLISIVYLIVCTKFEGCEKTKGAALQEIL